MTKRTRTACLFVLGRGGGKYLDSAVPRVFPMFFLVDSFPGIHFRLSKNAIRHGDSEMLNTGEHFCSLAT